MGFKKDTQEAIEILDRRTVRQEDALHTIENRQDVQSDNISKLVVAQNRLIKQLKSSNHALRERQNKLETLLLNVIEVNSINGERTKYAIDRLAENAGLKIELVESTEEHIEVVALAPAKNLVAKRRR